MDDGKHVKKLRGGDQEEQYLRERTRGELHTLLSEALMHSGVPKELTEPEWLKVKSLPVHDHMEGVSIAYAGPENPRMTSVLEDLSAAVEKTRRARGAVEPTCITLRAPTLRKLVDAMEELVSEGVGDDMSHRHKIEGEHYNRLARAHDRSFTSNPHWQDDYADKGLLAARTNQHKDKPGSKPKPQTR